jgi:two-component system response regulator (stage 0 sporulation protein F)
MSKTVLIVDDDKNMCWILSRLLSEEGFRVRTASSAKEALSLIEDGGISFAILDYHLPDIDGIKLFEYIKRKYSLIPSILITSYGSKQLREEAEKAGFSAYFGKPFSNQELIRIIRIEASRGMGLQRGI